MAGLDFGFAGVSSLVGVVVWTKSDDAGSLSFFVEDSGSVSWILQILLLDLRYRQGFRKKSSIRSVEFSWRVIVVVLRENFGAGGGGGAVAFDQGSTVQ